MRPLLVRAALREPVERTPVWFMRQAGRCLEEYRALRERYGILEMARTPALCARVTAMPVARLGVDAAVLYADIMLPRDGMGVPFHIQPDLGPIVEQPVRTEADVAALRQAVDDGSITSFASDHAPHAEFEKAAPIAHSCAGVSGLETAVAATFTLLVARAQGQDRVNVPLDDPARPAIVKISQVSGSIFVKGYEGKEVVVEAHARTERDRVRRGRDGEANTEGMKRIPIAATGLSVEEESNEVRISTDSHMRAIDVTITGPTRANLILRTVNEGDIVVNGVNGEIDVNDINGNVTLTNVGGSAVAHALNGKVLVTMTSVNGKPMAFSSLNGDIDVTLPASIKANVSLASDQGDVFSDFDVVMSPPASKPLVEERGGDGGGKFRVKMDKTVRGTINGGGPEIQFKNFNGSIYIRKAGGRTSQ